MPRWKVEVTRTETTEETIWIEAPIGEEAEDLDYLTETLGFDLSDMDIIDAETKVKAELIVVPHAHEVPSASGTEGCALCGETLVWSGWYEPMTCAEYVEHDQANPYQLPMRHETVRLEEGVYAIANLSREHGHQVTVSGPWIHEDRTRNVGKDLRAQEKHDEWLAQREARLQEVRDA